MVDFGALSGSRKNPRPIDPIDIFLRLPKAPGIDDLWNSQAEALRGWFPRRNERDLVVKLNTGGGKTLVGLLIAQSIMHESGPVLYLSPNNLLVEQTMNLARQYGMQAVRYTPGTEFDRRFLDAQSVMVGTYKALFNGLSRFGISGGRTEVVSIEGIVLDDAHTVFSELRDTFTITVPSEDPMYRELTGLFRADFGEIGRQGTFDDVVSGRDGAVLAVPYWSWLTRADEIREWLAASNDDALKFPWPLLRDSFRLCHALISGRDLCITPMYPMVDMFPTFANCPRRIYMSATLADDSSIVRTFDAAANSVAKPISATSLAGVGERMILAPELMILSNDERQGLLKRLAAWVSENYGGVVIITPSRNQADTWQDAAEVVQGDDVAACVTALVEGTSNGPYAFPNRYDGIDLPGDSCRLLILDGLPRGTSSYDLYRAAVLEGSSALSASIAQRVEQGMGRGTRGGGDHCVVILAGTGLVPWVSRVGNSKLFTPTSAAQLSMGLEISERVGSPTDLFDTMAKCLERSEDWVEFHAQIMADAAMLVDPDVGSLAIAECERRFFALVRDGYYEKAIATVQKFLQETEALPNQTRGWLLELSAWGAQLWGDDAKSSELQQRAFGYNRALVRPRKAPVYTPISKPSRQSEQIVALVNSFKPRRGVCAYFEDIADWLTPNVTSNQFEESMRKLGEAIGFTAERPDHDIGLGPDVLWIMEGNTAWVIEAKYQKDPDNPLTKSEHGQVLEAFEWFTRQYPDLNGTRVIAHPNAMATDKVSAQGTLALTPAGLLKLIPQVRRLFAELAEMSAEDSALAGRCDQLLSKLYLRPNQLAAAFLESFAPQG